MSFIDSADIAETQHPSAVFGTLALVFDKIEIVVQNKPNDFFAWNKFYYFQFATMDVFVMVRPLVTEVVGATFNFF